MRRTVLLLLAASAGCAKPAPPPPAASPPAVAPVAPGGATILTPGGWTVTSSNAQGVMEFGGELRIPGAGYPGNAPAGPTRPDFNGEPLPDGAVARLDSAAYKLADGWQNGLLSLDGSTLLHMPSHSTALYRYDPVTLKPLGPPVGAKFPRSVGFGSPRASSRDGSRYAAISNEGGIDIFDTLSGKSLLHFPSVPNSRGSTVSLSADGKRAAHGNSYREKPGDLSLVCTVWDVDAGREVGRVAVAQSTTVVCHLTPDGRTLLTGGTHGGPNTVTLPDSPALFTQIWDVATQKEIARANWQLGSPAFSPDSKLVAVAGESGAGRVLADTRTGKVVTALKPAPASAGPAEATPFYGFLAFSPDSRVFAAWGRGVTRWDVATGDFLGTTQSPAASEFAVRVGLAFTGPNSIVAIESLNQSAYAWDGVSGRALTPPLRGHTRPIAALTFAAGGKEVVSAALDEVCRWDAATGAPLGRTPQRQQYAESTVALSADGSRGLVAGQVVELATRRPVGSPIPRPPGGPATPHFLTPDGARLALLVRGEKDHRVVHCRVLEVATGRVVVEVPLPPDPRLTHARLTPDGRRLVLACSKYNKDHYVSVQTWDAETGAKLGEFEARNAGLLRGFELLDADRALVATGYGKLTVVNVLSGRVERSIDDPERLACDGIALAPDGKRVAVVQTTRPTQRRHVRVYDLATGKVLTTVGPGALTYSGATSLNNRSADSLVAFSPDGRRLVTPEGETTALVWDVSPAE